MPQLKPPYPTTAGLFGKPTVINNVETLMNVPQIMQNGPEWFRTIGTPDSPGTKLFAVAGKGRYSGVVEVEMGTPIRTIIEDIANGIRDGKEFKAIQLGGASGSFITSDSLDLPVDYDTLAGNGIGMGAGGFVIIDENTCMVDLVRFYMEFIRNESCGKCTPCREGLRQAGRILHKILDGSAILKDIANLERYTRTMQNAAFCGLGQAAGNSLISSLKYFRQEYESLCCDNIGGEETVS
jgi:NADH:ubiquinone oxidoreductase subunit F (NADH-binding)